MNLNLYEKISDDLCIIGNSHILRFNVTLGCKNISTNNKINMHNEYRYTSNKYNNMNELITIRRRFDYYISLESMNKEINDFIMIRQQDMYYIKNKLSKIYNIFSNEDYMKTIYAYDDDGLVMIYKIDPIYIKGLVNSNYIILELTVVKSDKFDDVEGVTVTLSTGSMFDITIDKFMEIYYLFDQFNMYLSAQLLINYMSSPFIGTNSNIMNDDIQNNNQGFKGVIRKPYCKSIF